MVKIPEKITRDLKAGLSLEETLIKHNTNLKTLFQGKECIDDDLLYIQPTKFNNFRINRTINGKTTAYGTYSTLEDAITIRNCLNLYDWDKSKLMAIKEHYNIKDSQGD